MDTPTANKSEEYLERHPYTRDALIIFAIILLVGFAALAGYVLGSVFGMLVSVAAVDFGLMGPEAAMLDYGAVLGIVGPHFQYIGVCVSVVALVGWLLIRSMKVFDLSRRSGE